MPTPVDIFEEIVNLRRAGVPAALATIVGTRGSTPGQESMRLLVKEDGTFLGTVGGGCLEAEVYEAGLQVIREEVSRTLTFRLTQKDSPDSGLLCGGEVTVFIESITIPKLIVFGGGHVSSALCRVASQAGFHVSITDDRESYARADRFPEAAEVFARDFDATVADLSLQANTYIVIVTRGHKEDGRVLHELARRFEAGDQPKFLGMIGSRTKRAVLFRQLREAGVDEAFLETVRSPVGVLIGARSHDEIAVSIVAELIAVRRLGQDSEAAWAARPPRRARQLGGSGADSSSVDEAS
ncbi:MAG: XdhC/CoxI family protein [Planctomycetota bacterium]|nr:XdhC/CoxI family protein [Planctomycetota bacterium]